MHHLFIAATFFTVILFGLYWPGLSGGFFFDDMPNIVEVEAVHIPALSYDLLQIAMESGHAGPLGRPLSILTFALNYYGCGLDPYCFKLTNVIIHCVNTLMVGCFLLLISKGRFGYPSLRNGLLVLLTLIWAAHPIQLTSVLYVVQRMTSLSSTFVLIGLVMHVFARQNLNGCPKFIVLGVAWLIAFPLGLFSKETAILMIGYVFCYEFFVRAKDGDALDVFGRYYVGVFVLLSFAFVFYIILYPGFITSGYSSRSFSVNERFITELRVLWSYVQMVVLPNLSLFSLYHDDFQISHSLFSPISGLISLMGWVVAIIFMIAIRKRNSMISFAIAWFLVGHSLESSVFPLELMHEHRNYLASLFFPILIIGLCKQKFMQIQIVRFGVFSVLCAFAVYCFVLTYLRSNMYGDDLRRTQIEVQYHPMSIRLNYELGASLLNMYISKPSSDLISLAEIYIKKSTELDKNFKGIAAMLQIDCLLHKTANPERINELIARLERGPVGVHERLTMSGIARAQAEKTLCLNREDFDRLFNGFLANQNASGYDKAKILNVYGNYIWTQNADGLGALNAFEQAISYNQYDFANHFNKVQLLRWLGDRDRILEHLPKMVEIKMSKEERVKWDYLRSDLIKDGVLN